MSEYSSSDEDGQKGKRKRDASASQPDSKKARAEPTANEQSATEWVIGNSTKKLSISEFKGKTRVDLREYYVANGELKPTKKGVSLLCEDFDKLVKIIPFADAALARNGQGAGGTDDGKTEWEIGTVSKKLSVSEWKRHWRVDIREYYEDKESHKMKPTPKGVSLSLEDYARFKEILPKLSAALERKGIKN